MSELKKLPITKDVLLSHLPKWLVLRSMGRLAQMSVDQNYEIYGYLTEKKKNSNDLCEQVGQFLLNY